MRIPYTNAVTVLLAALTLGPAGAASAASAGHSSGAAITVAPIGGTPRTKFVVRFRAPSRTGRFGALTRSLNVVANGPTGRGCMANVDVAVPSSGRGARVTARLDPGGGNRWCKGSYSGTIEQIDAPPCRFNQVCITTHDRVKTIGHFSFRVS